MCAHVFGYRLKQARRACFLDGFPIKQHRVVIYDYCYGTMNERLDGPMDMKRVGHTVSSIRLEVPAVVFRVIKCSSEQVGQTWVQKSKLMNKCRRWIVTTTHRVYRSPCPRKHLFFPVVTMNHQLCSVSATFVSVLAFLYAHRHEKLSGRRCRRSLMEEKHKYLV